MAVAMSRVPPLGMASRALTERFMMICSIIPASASMAGSPVPQRVSRVMCSPSTRSSILPTLAMILFRSRTLGCNFCFRLNMSNCRVRLDARRAAPETSLSGSARSPRSAQFSMSRSLWPWMMVRMLLKSWATPAASWPMESSFCEWRSCVSRFNRSVMSAP